MEPPADFVSSCGDPKPDNKSYQRWILFRA